jgi:hypothetical protein
MSCEDPTAADRQPYIYCMYKINYYISSQLVIRCLVVVAIHCMQYIILSLLVFLFWIYRSRSCLFFLDT